MLLLLFLVHNSVIKWRGGCNCMYSVLKLGSMLKLSPQNMWWKIQSGCTDVERGRSGGSCGPIETINGPFRPLLTTLTPALPVTQDC